MSALLAHRLDVPCVISLHGGHAAVPPEEIRQMMAPVRGKFHYGGILDRLLRLRRDAVAEADAVIWAEEKGVSKRAAVEQTAETLIAAGVDVKGIVLV